MTLTKATSKEKLKFEIFEWENTIEIFIFIFMIS